MAIFILPILMSTSLPIILTIDPGAKEIGVAIFAGTNLRHFGVKTIAHRSAPHLVLAAVAQLTAGLMLEFHPTVLAIEHTPRRPTNTALLNVVAAEIKACAQQRGLHIYEYWPLEVRQQLCQHTKATRHETAQWVASRYPELTRYLNRPTKWETQYWGKMFDAVAVGICCWNEINQIP